MTSVVKCPMGSYGDGIICTQCPFATWTSQIGALDISQCVRSFTYRDPGQLKSYIPFGVTQIVVKIWGGGGGSDNSSDPNFASHSGGGGGFTSCNLTVAHSRNVYVIVGGGGGAYSLTTNAGGVFWYLRIAILLIVVDKWFKRIWEHIIRLYRTV